jgi:hypothetical protein
MQVTYKGWYILCKENEYLIFPPEPWYADYHCQEPPRHITESLEDAKKYIDERKK